MFFLRIVSEKNGVHKTRSQHRLDVDTTILAKRNAFQEFEHTKSQEVDFFDSWTTLDDHLHGGLSVMSDAVKPTATNPPIWDA